MTISAVASRQTAASQDTQASYTIQRGDTLSAIAKQHGVSLSALLAANPQVRNPDLIYPGEHLDIPHGSSGNGTSSPSATHPAASKAAAGGHAASGFSISQDGVKMLEGFEGLRLNAYQDSGGVWTIGYGHTGGVHAGQHISQAQAEQFLKQDLAWAQSAVRSNVHVPINQNQFDALVSLTYNLGAHGYPGLLSKLNSGDYAGAQAMFGEYVHAGGQVLQGLVTRRAKEAALFGSSAPGGTTGTPTNPPGNPPSHPAGGSYTVHSGDTMSGIAARNGVSLSALMAANPQVHNANLIYPGQTLHLPGSGSSNAGKSHDYTVHSGDSMSAIAARNGVSLNSLLSANPQIHNPNLIYAGQTIHIPGGSGNGSPPPASATHNYTVRSGDTMSGIAAHNGVSLASLEHANPQISNFNRISIGQVIHVPGAGSSGPVEGPGPSGPVKGTDAAAMAKKYLGRYESDLQNAGVTMRVDTSESCANFVTAMLKQSGKLPSNFSFVQRVNVHSMSTGLQSHGWHKVSLANAKPGDVWVCDGAHGESHTEIVASNDGHGHITLIGSNNHPVRSNQQINYDTYSASISGSYILAPP